jgi:hypothetical protein
MKKLFETIYNGWLWVVNIAVFGQWTKFWDWIKLAHSQSDEASCKRLYGGLGVLACIAILFLVGLGVISPQAWSYIAAYWTILLVFSFGMISLGVVEKVAGLITTLKLAQTGVTPPEIKATEGVRPAAVAVEIKEQPVTALAG